MFSCARSAADAGGRGVAFELGGGEGIRRTKPWPLVSVGASAAMLSTEATCQTDATREGGEDVTLEVKLNAKLRNAQTRASR